MQENRESENIEFCNTFTAEKNSFCRAKPWGSSSFLIKDIVRDELQQAPLTPSGDFKTAMLQGETTKRRSDNSPSALTRAKPSVVDEITVPLQTFSEIKEQSSLVLVDPGESSWYVQGDDTYKAQLKQELNEEVLGQWAVQKSKEELMKSYPNNSTISSFGEGAERPACRFSPSEIKYQYVQKESIARARGCRKGALAEDLPVSTHNKEETDKPFNKKAFHWKSGRARSCQWQQTQCNEYQSPFTVPTFIKEEVETTPNYDTFGIKPQKTEQKDFLRSGKANLESSENSVLVEDACYISVPERKTETDASSQETKGDPNEEFESPGSLPRKVKNRSSFSVQQICLLEKTFERQKYLGTKEREQLAQTLELSDTQVKTWFQNRRMKMKRKRAEVTQQNARLAYLDSVATTVHCSTPCYHSNYLDHIPASAGAFSPSCLMPSRPLGVFSNQPAITSPQWVDSPTLYPSPGYGRISPPICADTAFQPLYPGLLLPYRNSAIPPFAKDAVSSFDKNI